jgi:hypothetical protein
MSVRPEPDPEKLYAHTQAVFSVSAAMIGVCLTSIGLVKVVANGKEFQSLCDRFIVVDALLFGLSAWMAFRCMNGLIKGRVLPQQKVVDWVFLLALALMILICGVFTWDLI